MGVLIPTNPGCAPVEAPAACNRLFEMGEYLLAAAYDGLTQFEQPPGSPCGGSLETIVSLGQPAVDLCDTLFIWLVNYMPHGQDVARGDRAGQTMFSPQWLATWQLELWEAAYPTVANEEGGTTVQLEDPQHLHDLNRYVYAHGVAMHQGIHDAITSGTLYPEDVPCDSVIVTQVRPAEPQGGCAGWIINLRGPIPAL